MTTLTLGAGTHTFTTLTIGDTDDVTCDATSGSVTVHVNTITNHVNNTSTGEGLIFTNNATNDIIVSKNTTPGTRITYTGPGPRFETNSGTVQFGETSGSRAGIEFPDASTLDLGVGAATSQTLELFETNKVHTYTLPSGFTMDIGSSILIGGGSVGPAVWDWSGSVTEGTGIVQADGIDLDITTTSGANTFYTITVSSGTLTIDGVDSSCVAGGTLGTIGGATLTLTGIDLTLLDTQIANISNSGTINGTGTLRFRTTGTNRILPALSNINVADVEFDAITSGAIITFGGDQTYHLSTAVLVTTSLLTFNLGSNTLDCGSFTATANTLLTLASATIRINGNWTTSATTDNFELSQLHLDAAGTITTDGTTGQEFDTIDVNHTGTVTIATAFDVNSVWNNNSNAATIAMNANITLTATSGTPWSNASAVLFTGSSVLKFEGSALAAINIVGNHPGCQFLSTNGVGTHTATATGDVNFTTLVTVNPVASNSYDFILGSHDMVGSALTVSQDGGFTAVGDTPNSILTVNDIIISGTSSSVSLTPVSADGITITLANTLTVGNLGTLSLDTSGSSVASIITADVISATSSSNLTLKGTSGAKLDINSPIRLIGNAASIDISHIDCDSSDVTFGALDISNIQGNLSIGDSTFTSSAAPGFQISASLVTTDDGTDITSTTFTGAGGAVPDVKITAGTPQVVMQPPTSGSSFVTVGYIATGFIYDIGSGTDPHMVAGLFSFTDVNASVISALASQQLAMIEDLANVNETTVTVDTNIVCVGVQSTTDTGRATPTGNSTLVVDAANSFTIDATTTKLAHSLGKVTLDGTFTWSPTTTANQILTLLGDWTLSATATWTMVPTVSGMTLDYRDEIDVTMNAAGTVTWNGSTERIAFVHTVSAGGDVDPSNRFGSGTTTITSCDFTDFGRNASARIAPVIVGTATVTVSDCTFTSCAQAIFILNGANPILTITKCKFTNNTSAISGQSSSVNINIKDCIATGGTNGFTWAFFDFRGRVENCIFKSQRAINISSGTDIEIGAIQNSVFNGTIDDVTTNNDKVHLVGCMLSATPDITHNNAADYLISWHHQRTNNKEVLISGPVVVDSSFYSAVEADTFDWDWVAGEWEINAGNNRFEAAIVTTTSMKSIFIPCIAGTTYFLRYRGDVNSVTVQGYEFDQSTTTVANSSWSASGDDFTGSLVTNASTDFLQFEVSASVIGQDFYDIEIRETNSIGNIIWNEDLISNYMWDTSGVDYVSNELALDATTSSLIFGDVDYDQLDMIAEFNGIDSAADEGGFIVGWQDANNYYKIFIDFDTDIVKYVKVVAGVSTTIDTAALLFLNISGSGGSFATGDTITGAPSGDTGTLVSKTSSKIYYLPVSGTFAGETSLTVTSGGTANIDSIGSDLTDPVDFRITWNDAVAGGVKVFMNGGINLTWVTAAASTTSTVDTTFTQGKIGYIANSAEIDDVLVKQFGLFLRDTDLVVDAGATINVTTGEFTYKRGNVNATRAIVTSGSGSFTEEDVTWLDDSFDESITGTVSAICAKIEVESDIILEALGKLVAQGAVFVSSDTANYWTIQTELSTVEPPLDIKSCLFKNLNPRFRPHSAPDGAPYEVDQTKEFIFDSPEPTHSPDIISHPVWGRARHRNTIRGFNDEEVTLSFRVKTIDGNCLYGKLRKWMDDEALLEVIWPRGYIWKCKVVDLAGGGITRGMNLIEFSAALKEFR